MKVLLVDYDDILLSFLTTKLEGCGFAVVPTHFGDGRYLYKKDGPFDFVLSDYRFIPGPEIKDGVQLVTAIHAINPAQRMALMTAWCEEARGKLPQTLRYLPVLQKPFRFELVLRVLREPVLPL